MLISPNIDKQSKLKYVTDVNKIIIEEQYTYNYPITEYVRLVFRSSDFKGASVMLGHALDVIECDFFWSYWTINFIEYVLVCPHQMLKIIQLY